MSSVDVLILCLNEGALVAESIYRLKREGHRIIVVDNGSDDGSKDILRATDGITLIDLTENTGSSVGRNHGIQATNAEYVFLMDGDILYVPGTITGLLTDYPADAGCVGVQNPLARAGTLDRDRADTRWPTNPGKRYSDFKMAWTQYGLFRGDLLRSIQFHAEGVFGEPGVGYEDDWYFQELNARGLKSYYYPLLTYYHERHGGARFLNAKGLPVRDAERQAAFKSRWPDVVPWHDDPTTMAECYRDLNLTIQA